MQFYTLVDRPSWIERENLGFPCTGCLTPSPWVNPIRPNFEGIVAITTGEKRPPRRGEWYLSGALPEGYRAPNDLSTAFHILKLVRVKTTLVTTFA